MEPFGSLCNCPAFHTSGDEEDLQRNSILVLSWLKEGLSRDGGGAFARTGVRKKDQSTHIHTFLEVLIITPGTGICTMKLYFLWMYHCGLAGFITTVTSSLKTYTPKPWTGGIDHKANFWLTVIN